MGPHDEDASVQFHKRVHAKIARRLDTAEKTELERIKPTPPYSSEEDLRKSLRFSIRHTFLVLRYVLFGETLGGTVAQCCRSGPVMDCAPLRQYCILGAIHSTSTLNRRLHHRYDRRAA